MKLLLDECIDRRLATEIQGHDVTTVPDAGWAGLRNGELLSRAQSEFDGFITVDQSLPRQQNLDQFAIAVVVLRSRSNRIVDLRPLVPSLLSVLVDVEPGAVTWVDDAPGRT